MLSFSAEFPLQPTATADAFLRTIKTWLLASPYSQFSESDLDTLTAGTESNISAGSGQLHISGGTYADECILGARYILRDQEVDWITEISFSKAGETWASVRTYRDSTVPSIHLPPAKKPVVVMTILDHLGGGRDGPLYVRKTPHRLKNDEIDLASQLILGESDCYLPVVYVSSTFDGADYLSADVLARDLCGMAHVVVEPNRHFSQRLQIEVNSFNPYGGAIGIYWPDGAGRTLRLPDRSLSFTQRRQAIAQSVRDALLHRRPLSWCSWTAAQQISAKSAVESLRSSGSGAIEDYIENFDKEIRAKEQQLIEAEAEISRLNAALRAGSREKSASGVRVKVTSEQDYYPEEIVSVIRDAAADCISRVQPNGRREHILRAVISANPPSSVPVDAREKLKTLLRDYRTMTKDVREGLASLGLQISEDGKHYNAVYNSDDRYVFAIPKTSSDHRAGLNMASDIAKRIY